MEKHNTVGCYESQATSCDSATGPQFKIRSLSFWMMVIAGAIPVALSEPSYPPVAVFYVGAYLTIVCGIATFVRFPSSPDAWIPIVVASLLFVLLITNQLLIPLGKSRDQFIQALFFAGLPLGVFLLVRNVIRITRTGFSLTVFVYHLGVWLGWVGITVAILAAPIT